MSGLITFVWVGQGAFLWVMSLLCLFCPNWIFHVISGRPAATGALPLLITAGSLRLLAPLLLGVSLFSSAAAMREEERVRREMAGAFALLLGLCVFVFVGRESRGWGSVAERVISGVVVLGFALQCVYALWPHVIEIEPRMSGTADTKPPQLWGLWAVQAFGFIALGAAEWITPWSLVTKVLFTPGVAGAALGLRSADFILDLNGALYIGVGLLSLRAMRTDREWHWQLYSGIFAVFSGASLVTMLIVWNTGIHTALPLLPMFGMLAVFVGNLRFWRRRADPIAEEIGHGPDGWTLLDVPVGPLLSIQSLMYGRRRATHLMGVAARGTFVVVDDLECPNHLFFNSGDKHPVQMRFAALSSRDDASLDLRGAALRLSDHLDVASPFDMLMNSGSVAGPNNMVLFTLGVVARFLPQRFFDSKARDSLLLREGLIIGRRRAPESYALVHFYSQMVRFWIDEEDTRWLVRYRVWDPSCPESGLPTPEDAAAIWVRERLATEHRPSDYLRTELKRRVARPGGVKLLFQAQFHRPRAGDTLDWYNAAVEWPIDGHGCGPDCQDHAWRDLAMITLTEALSDEETELLRFNASNHPPSLGIPAATDVYDYRSLADSERRVIRRLADHRHWMYRTMGLPKFGNTLPDAGSKR